MNNDQPGSGSVKSARNWRGSSDLTSSILTIGAACAISMSLARGPGPLSCKTATQISNPRFDCHSTGMGMVTVACRDAKSNRVESMFPAALLRCKCIHPSSSSPLPSFFILRALSFHPSPIDRNILFLLREREREGGILGCIRHLPYPRHRRAKMVKRGEKGVEVDVGAGNAHAYDRRREMLVTV